MLYISHRGFLSAKQVLFFEAKLADNASVLISYLYSYTEADSLAIYLWCAVHVVWAYLLCKLRDEVFVVLVEHHFSNTLKVHFFTKVHFNP